MSTFLERLEKEESELEDKIEALNDFIEENPAFNNVSPIQQALLRSQLAAMRTYLTILYQRLFDLSETAKEEASNI